jgi:predicted nucleotidyltransferase
VIEIEKMNKINDFENTKKKVLPILITHNVTKAGIFGSYVRGDMKYNSDVDMLVEIKDRISILDFVGLKLELEEVLGKRVDLVEYKAIKPILKERILAEERTIL